MWLWSFQRISRLVPCYLAIFMVVQVDCCEGAGSHSFSSSLWGNSWSGQHVPFHVDDLAVVSVLQRKSAKGHMLGNLVQFVCFYAAFCKFIFSATDIPSWKNVAADAISWNNLQLSTSHFIRVPRVLIPPATLDLIIHRTPDWSSLEWIESFRAQNYLHRKKSAFAKVAIKSLYLNINQI